MIRLPTFAEHAGKIPIADLAYSSEIMVAYFAADKWPEAWQYALRCWNLALALTGWRE